MGNEEGKSSRCKLPPLTKTNTKINIKLNTLLKSMPLKTKKNTNKNMTTKSKYIGSSKKRFPPCIAMIIRLNFKVDPWDALQA